MIHELRVYTQESEINILREFTIALHCAMPPLSTHLIFTGIITAYNHHTGMSYYTYPPYYGQGNQEDNSTVN